jgi:hypothetical protein
MKAAAGPDGASLPSLWTEGDQVRCRRSSIPGVVKYMGEVDFADGVWVGLEVEAGQGKNDGAIGERRYFSTEAGRGLFVRPSALDVAQHEAVPSHQKAAGATHNSPSPKTDSEVSLRRRDKPDKSFSYFTYNKVSSSLISCLPRHRIRMMTCVCCIGRQLVGEADGGRQLPTQEFKKLLKLYHSNWGGNRIYVHWRNR